MERQEASVLEERFNSADRSITMLLGPKGSGKSALLSRVCQKAAENEFAVLAIKADYLAKGVDDQEDLAKEMGLSGSIAKCIATIVDRKPVLLVIDQLDALSDLMDLNSGRLNAILNLIRSCQGLPRVHIVCSCREFEFRHDTRLNLLNAERLDLQLPAWEQVSAELKSERIADAERWPEKFREILRVPQNLDVFIQRYQETGKSDVFDSYQQMLDEMWSRTIDTDQKRELIYQLTGQLVDSEELWLPAARFEDHNQIIDKLEADGVLKKEGFRIGFRHQTMLEHARARSFIKDDQSLAEHVLERQHALFVRPTLWSTLSYLRDADRIKYRKEIEDLFQAEPRLHVRHLLIDFLGKHPDPADYEIVLLTSRLENVEDRKRVLIAIRGQKAWFDALYGTHLPSIMNWPLDDLWPMIGILADAWEFSRQQCFELIDRYFLPDASKDNLTWRCLDQLSTWDERAVERVRTLIQRAVEGQPWWAEKLASLVSEDKPDLAPRIVSTVLWKVLKQIEESKLDNPGETPNLCESLSFRNKSYDDAFGDRDQWYNLSEIAKAASGSFLREIWPWFIAVTEALCHRSASSVVNEYGGSGLAFCRDDNIQYPIAQAIMASVNEVACNHPEEFDRITRESWTVERLPVQLVLTYGLAKAADKLPEIALEFLCSDPRRFSLGGSWRGDQHHSCELITALSPHLDQHGMKRLVETILHWSKYRDSVDPEECQVIWDREARLRLLNAIPQELLSTETASFVESEKSRLPEWDHKPTPSRAGRVSIIPPMRKEEILNASDEDVIHALRDNPNDGINPHEWSENDDGWIRPGGPESMATELGKLAIEQPKRVAALLPKIMSDGYESVVSRVLSHLEKTPLKDRGVFDLLESLSNLGANSEEFRSNAAILLGNRCRVKSGLPDSMCSLLERWLDEPWKQLVGPTSNNSVDEQDQQPRSVLWGDEGGLISCDGSYWVLSALTHGYLMREPADTEKWQSVIEQHIDRDLSEETWRSYCHELRWLRLRDCNKERGIAIISKLFEKYPGVRDSHEGIVLLAEVASALTPLMLEQTLEQVQKSQWSDGVQAYGELLTLIALRDKTHAWATKRLALELGNLSNPLDGTKERLFTGIAFAAAQLWDEPEMRSEACEILCKIIPPATPRVATAVGTVFWASDDFSADDATERLLNAIAPKLPILTGHQVSTLMGHLEGLLPHCTLGDHAARVMRF